MINSTDQGKLPKISNLLFIILTSIFVILYFTDETLYRKLISEDNIIEWLTFVSLIGAGIVSLIIAIKIKKKYKYLHWFFILFFLFNVLAGFEEISWGQRVFQVESGEFFQKHSDQKEINMHNTFQGVFQIKTKHIALIMMFIYGVILPWLIKKEKIKIDWIKNGQLIVPPYFLILGFLLASVLMLDFQTGHEEELGEFYFSLCYFLMMLWNLMLLNENSAFNRQSYFNKSKSTPSLNE